MKFVFPLLLLGSCMLARGAVLFNNGAPGNNVERSDFEDVGKQMGDEFTLATASSLQGTKWWGIYGFGNSPQTTDLFRVQIFAVTAGVPAASPLFESSSLAITRSTTGTSIGGFAIYEYNGTLPNTVLAAGTYVFSVMNDTRGDTNDDWYWMTSALAGGAGWERSTPYPDWASERLVGPSDYDPVPNMAFNLSGAAVPEPSALSLLTGVGVCGVLSGRGARVKK
jgi:hypothetical protein